MCLSKPVISFCLFAEDQYRPALPGAAYINAVYIDVSIWLSLSLVPIYKRCIYRCESLGFFIFDAYINAVYIDVSPWLSLSLLPIYKRCIYRGESLGFFIFGV